MSSSAGRYHARAPRYILRPLDSNQMRFARLQTRGFAMEAEVLDLSESGLSFTLEGDVVPQEGETLKIEFTVPGRQQIACFATVVRIENQNRRPSSDSTDSNDSSSSESRGDSVGVKVALRFHGLPEAFQRSLRLSLRDRVRTSDTDGSEEQMTPATGPQKPSFAYVVAMAAAGAGLIALFHIMTTPPEKIFALFF